MEILVTVASIIFLVVGIFVGQKGKTTPTLTQTPTQIPTFTPTLTSTPKIEQSSDEWVYPGSRIISSNPTNLSLASGDEPEKIGDWYQNKVEQKGMNTSSFASSQANDNAEIKLSAAGKEGKVNIEIKRNAGDKEASIKVFTD